MKKKYVVGFFLALFCMVLLVSAGYAASYRYVMQRQEVIRDGEIYVPLYREAREEAEKREEDFLQQSVMTEGDATKKTSGYYLKELNGYVAVYRADGTSLYETTNIPVEALPDDLRADLDKGRYIETPEELYGFLENYSS